MEEEIKNLIKIWLSITASLCYCYFIPSRIPKGKYRLLSLLPILSLFTILPLHLTCVFPIFAVTGITWLANSKLLLFSFDLGPLSSNPPKSLPFFITFACLPTRITNQNHESQIPTKPRNLALSLAIEIVILSLLMGVLLDYRERLIQHGIVLVLLYCVVVFLLVDILFAVSNVGGLLGLEIEPPSDEPYLATSLQDFWGRRWNLTVTNILRHIVYKPVWAGTVGVLGKQWAQVVGVLSTFLVSGLMHELLLFYVTRVSPTWEMTGFFMLHGVGVAAEKCVERALPGQWRLHWAVSRPLTVGFVVATSFWLFFPPLMRNNVDVRAIDEFKMFMDFMKMKLTHV
ncbi:hypothetical protein RHSIM_Rhsim06G0224500 [Rhododendron simsii]|uniref:Wax synthase domain-containing protein n=1 Tax=Rhododendron simsii TaxID=118357 RepID=A0A834LN16_RHOSS|nr:hypothetical protein RHSIM_Rhsim06G0224500 [Rhododendron simsii]